MGTSELDKALHNRPDISKVEFIIFGEDLDITKWLYDNCNIE